MAKGWKETEGKLGGADEDAQQLPAWLAKAVLKLRFVLPFFHAALCRGF